MTAVQVAGSLALWLLYAWWAARRVRSAPPLDISRSKIALLCALVMIATAAAALGGLYLTLRFASVAATRGILTWLLVSVSGLIFVAGQAEAAGLLVRALIPRPRVTPEPAQPSASSTQSQPLP